MPRAAVGSKVAVPGNSQLPLQNCVTWRPRLTIGIRTRLKFSRR